HYRAFRPCPSLEKLRAQHSMLYPEFQKFGIHVMASQNADGEVILGDSHEYDAAITPFDHRRIDELILQYLRQMLTLPAPEPVAHWHGIYAKHPTKPFVVIPVRPGVTGILAAGGAGMTMSFGLAHEYFEAQSHRRNYAWEAA
ncbi:MAG: FAD-dependent oxidoreductase, partial [Gemmataceae bacterium]